MEKNNEARPKLTLCELCSRPAEVFTPEGKAYCGLHHPELVKKVDFAKEADHTDQLVTLKSASGDLESQHSQ